MHIYIQNHPNLIFFFCIIISLIVGSFLNVVIYRLPLMMKRNWHDQCNEISKTINNKLPQKSFNLILPRSHCPNCNSIIKAKENIPLFSYLLLNGKCNSCKENISLRYPFIELLTTILTCITLWKLGLSIEGLIAIIVTWSLIVISAIDFDEKYIFDDVVLPLLWLGLFISIFDLKREQSLFIEPSEAILGAIFGYLSLWIVYKIFLLFTGKEGMGYGDFKLLAALGAWLGWQLIPIIILISAISGSIIGIFLIINKKMNNDTTIPFGPYLSFAGWIAMLWGNEINNYYFINAF